MAKDYNYNSLGDKANNVSGDRGKLTAEEWSWFVDEVERHDTSIKDLNRSAVKGIFINNETYTSLDANGILQVGTLGTDRTLSINWINPTTPTNMVVARGTSIPVTFLIKDENKDGSGNNLPGKLTYSIYDTNGKENILKIDENAKHGSTYTFDFGEAGKSILTTEGAYTMNITYSSAGATPVMSNFTCEIINLNVEINNTFKDVYTSEDEVFPQVGARKGSELHYWLNGVSNVETFGSNGIINLGDVIKSSKHGINNFKMQVVYKVDPTDPESLVLYYPSKDKFIEAKYLYADTSKSEPVIMTDIMNGASYKLYSTMALNYSIYAPKSIDEATVTINLKNTEGTSILNTNSTVKIENYKGNGTALFNFTPKNTTTGDMLKSIKTVEIVLTGTDYSASEIISISVEHAEVPYNEVTDALSVYLDADGRTNTEDKDTLKVWKYKNANGEEFAMEFPSNIEFTKGASGWITEPGKGDALRLRRGKYCTLNYTPFSKEVCYDGTTQRAGKTISFEFETINCFKNDAPVIKCMSGRWVKITRNDKDINIADSLKTVSELPEQSTSNESYMINDELYSWNDETKSWEMVGLLDPDENTVVWKGVLTTAPLNPEFGWVYTEDNGNSYIYSYDAGFVINTSNLLISSRNGVKQLSAKFKENERLRVDFVIEGTPQDYYYKSYLPEDPANDNYNQIPKNDTSTECLILVYIDGVYAGLVEYYSKAGEVLFKQEDNNIQKITFGSDYCDLNIYKIRIYDKSLTIEEILANYAFDTYDPDGTKRATIARRNNIFEARTFKNNKPNINKAALDGIQDIPKFTVKLDKRYNTATDKTEGELTNTKEDWQLCEISKYWDDTKKSSMVSVWGTSWESNTGTIRNQGTSSMNYPWPWRNWDWKTGDSDFVPTGMSESEYKNSFLYYIPEINASTHSTASKWIQQDYSASYDDIGGKLGLKKLTFKKDYASSEMCNNAVCSDLFTDFAIKLANHSNNYRGWNTDTGEFDPTTSVLSPKMAEQLDASGFTDYRLSLKAIPCFMYQEVTVAKDKDGNIVDLGSSDAMYTAGQGYDALGMMNLIPNKNEVGYLGFSKNKWEKPDETDKVEQAWECVENWGNIYWKTPFPEKAAFDTSKVLPGKTGPYDNPIVKNYEARTPKDSPIFDKDFGHVPDGTTSVDKATGENLLEQTKYLRRFHNWLVQVNRGTATGLKLQEASVKYGPIGEGWMDDIVTLQNDYPEYADVDITSQIDNADWRLRRFKTEAKDYLIINQWLMYYLWREMFWMFDSGFKNLQIYTIDGKHWGCMVRDADTALGINNVGEDIFPPHLEDIDLWHSDANGKVIIDYNAAADILDGDALENTGMNAVLNGQFGSIWLNIRDSYKDKLNTMYKDLKDAGIKSDYLINKFRSHQEHWSEALYNFGMRQYCCGAPFLDRISAGLGDKKHSRAQWLNRGIYYRQGKYRAWDMSDSTNFRFRLNNVYLKETNENGVSVYTKCDNSKIKFTTYMPVYLGVGGSDVGGDSIHHNIRVVDVNNNKDYSVEINTNESGLNLPVGASSEGNTYIMGTMYITDMTEMFKCMTPTSNLAFNMPYLRKFEIGHESARDNKEYYITNDNGVSFKPLTNSTSFNVSFENTKNLTCIDVTGMTALSELSNLDVCTQLEELYIRNTAVKSLVLPETSTLKTLYLNKNLTALNFNNLTSLKKVVIPQDGYSNIASISITNPSEYMRIESQKYVENSIKTLKKCNINNVYWGTGVDENGASRPALSFNVLESLAKLPEVDWHITGEVYVDKMTATLKNTLNAKYTDIDSPLNEGGKLYITYPKIEITKVSFNRSQYWLEPNQTSLDLSNQLKYNDGKTDPNTGKKITWSIEGDPNEYVNVNEYGVITWKKKHDNSAPKSVTVKAEVPQITSLGSGNPAMFTITATINLTENIARPGDIVYADGSFSSEWDDSANPIGICFYTNGNDRLMFGLVPQYTEYWGLSAFTRGSSSTSTAKDTSIQGLYLIKDGNHDVNSPYAPFETYARKSIADDLNQQSNATTGVTSIFSDGCTYLDTDKNFNIFTSSALKTLGFTDAEKRISISQIDKNGASTSTEVIKQNEHVPYGYYETAKAIALRNDMLTQWLADMYNTDNKFDMLYPKATDALSEMQSLAASIEYVKKYTWDANKKAENDESVSDKTTAIIKWIKTGPWADLYYDVASKCWAYQPIVDKSILSDKFKSHNWFLPTYGDACRISYYAYCVINGSCDNENTHSNNFAKFMDTNTAAGKKFNNIFGTGTKNILTCSDESTIGGTLKISPNMKYYNSNSNNYYTYKHSINTSSDIILPICKF